MRLRARTGRRGFRPPPADAFWYSGLITPVHYWDARAAATATPADLVGSADMTVAAGTPTYSATGWGVGGLPTISHDDGDVLSALTSFFTAGQDGIVSISFRDGGAANAVVWSLGQTSAFSYWGAFNDGASNWRWTGNAPNGATTWGAADTGRHVTTLRKHGAGRFVTVYQDGTRVRDAIDLGAPWDENMDRIAVAALFRGTASISGTQAMEWGDLLVGQDLADTGPLAAFHSAHLAEWPLS